MLTEPFTVIASEHSERGNPHPQEEIATPFTSLTPRNDKEKRHPRNNVTILAVTDISAKANESHAVWEEEKKNAENYEAWWNTIRLSLGPSDYIGDQPEVGRLCLGKIPVGVELVDKPTVLECFLPPLVVSPRRATMPA